MNGKTTSSRSFVLPGAGRARRRTQSGVPCGMFFSKNVCPFTPSGQRFRVTGRSRRCGSSSPDAAVR